MQEGNGENLFGEVTNINIPGSDGSTTISTPKETNSFQEFWESLESIQVNYALSDGGLETYRT